MQNDTISDMLTRIRNANTLHKTNVDIPWTRVNEQILELFVQEGFIEAVEKQEKPLDSSPVLTVTLKYEKSTNKACITNLQRMSKPGLRLYSKAKDIPQVLGGMGVIILSTSKGILTSREAKQKKVGGEFICSIW